MESEWLLLLTICSAFLLLILLSVYKLLRAITQELQSLVDISLSLKSNLTVVGQYKQPDTISLNTPIGKKS